MQQSYPSQSSPVHQRRSEKQALSTGEGIAGPTARVGGSSIARPPEIGGVATTESRFQPLATLSDSAPASYRRRWQRLAARATTSYRDAVELKCLECCTWNRTEVKRCQIQGCPLWGVARRIFGSEEPP